MAIVEFFFHCYDEQIWLAHNAVNRQNNLIGLEPYVFTMSAHLKLSLTIALPL